MPEPGGARKSGSGGLGGIGDAGSDVVKLIVAYVKQETVGPLRGVARFVAFGLAGSIALSGGTVLLLLALLRLLQDETGTTFGGDRSWLPYVVVVVAGLLVLALSAWRVASGPARRRASGAGGRPGREEA